MQLSEFETNKLNELGQSIQNEEWTNDGIVQLIELAGSFLNLKTITDYAKENNLSYNGVKNHRETKQIFGVKFVIDNE